jgi:hypothetical protein
VVWARGGHQPRGVTLVTKVALCHRATSKGCVNLPGKMPNEQETEKTAAPDMPQFATAEYAHVPGTERCRICNNIVFDDYYRVNGQMACAKCAGEARQGMPSDSHAAFARAMLLGGGAAVLGMALYAAFTITTNFYFGYIALGVGWLVAKAMLKGSNGIGGRRYQIAAVLLTYAAISVAAVPIGIASVVKHKNDTAVEQKRADDATTSSAQDSGSSENAGQSRSEIGRLLVQLVLWGLASPFLELQDPLHGLIGLVILFVGLRIAWQMTSARPLEVDGPYPIAAS